MAGERTERLAGRRHGRTTGSVLDGMRADGWSVFHDVRWPGSRRSSVDHVIVGPAGVFVIDAKKWSGRIEVRDNHFWCRGRRQDRVVGSASEAALAIAGLVSGAAVETVRSALCFERDEPVVGWCYDVMLCSTANLRDMLVRRPQVLTADQVSLAAIELGLGFRAAAEQPVRTARPEPRLAPVKARRPRSDHRWFGRGLRRLSIFLILAVLLITQLPRLADLRDSVIDKVRHALVPEELVHSLGYDSCDAVRAIYPNGVGTAAAVRNLKHRRNLPAVQSEVYRASAALDKDGDGIVCER